MNVFVPEYAPDFRPSHVVPRDGLPAWESPDPGRPTVSLDAFLPVQLMERAGDWGRVLCSNGWSAWVDARLLVAVPADPPAAGRPLARTADPRPLIARAEDALGRYRRAAEELAAGRANGEGFRQRTRGLRVGMVVDGESVWLYDAEHERWVYCDGVGLGTYAASSPPASMAAPSDPGSRTAARADGWDGADGWDETDERDGPDEREGPDSRRDEPSGPPAVYEPTQVVPQVDPAGAAGPPPTQVVERPPGDRPDRAGER
ncbi:hypothetical protein [Streptomyces sp. NPDC003327]